MMRWEGWIVATAITYIVLDSGSCGKMLVLFAKLRLRLTTERGTPFMPFFLALIQFWIHEEVYKHLFGASHFLHCLLNGRSWLFFCGVWKSYRLAFVLLASREYSCISFQLLVFLFFLSSFLFSALRPEDDIFITRFWFWMQSFILDAIIPTGVLVPDWSLFAVKLNSPIISRNFPCFPRDAFCIWVSSLLFRSWVVGVPVWARMRAKPAVGPSRTSHLRRVDQGEAMLIISSIEGTLLSTAGRRG